MKAIAYPPCAAKRAAAVFLACIIAFSCFGIAAYADEVYPTIYIKGQGTALTADATFNGEIIYPVNIPDGYIEEKAKELSGPIAKGVLLNQWADYGNGLYDAMYPFFSKFALDCDGEVTDKSGSRFQSTYFESTIYHENSTNQSSPCKIWRFEYDWRIDPCAAADILNDYINAVMKKSGKNKVNLLARCLGADIVLAYFDKYGSDNVAQCLFCCAGFEGFESIGTVFAGKFRLDGAAVDRFANTYLTTDEYADDPTFELLVSLVSVMRYNLTLDITADVLERALNSMRDDAVKRIIRDCLGTMPSFWALIGDDYYEDAKAYLFGGEEEKYAGLIEKIDRFHDILVRWEDITDEAEANGTYIYNVCKYGFQLVPLFGKDKTMSDTLISTERTSLGAYCSDIDGQLNSSYLKIADPKYISPDKQIDASTCKYPEHTWFIKNLSHRNMPECIDYLFAAILSDNNYTTVDDLEEYPQFLMCSDDNTVIYPATQENSSLFGRVQFAPFRAFIEFFKKLVEFLKNL